MGINKQNNKTLCQVIIFFMLLSCFLLAPLTSQASTATHIQYLMNPPAKAKSTWLGADIAASVTLSEDRVLWLFGDTLFGRSAYPKRFARTMMHNSIAIMSKQASHWKIKKYMALKAFFQPTTKHEYVWPMSGVMVKGKLILLMNIYKENENFHFLYNAIAIVQNPQASPPQWKVQIQKIEIKDVIFTTLVKIENNVYAFAYKHNSHHEFLYELPITVAEKNRWRHWVYMGIVKGLPKQSEISIVLRNHYWYTAIEAYLSRQIHLYRSARLHGPWKLLKKEYVAPVMGNSLFSYAPKVHDFYHSKNKLLLSYNTNVRLNKNPWQLLWFLRQKHYQFLYVPRFVVVSINHE